MQGKTKILCQSHSQNALPLDSVSVPRSKHQPLIQPVKNNKVCELFILHICARTVCSCRSSARFCILHFMGLIYYDDQNKGSMMLTDDAHIYCNCSSVVVFKSKHSALSCECHCCTSPNDRGGLYALIFCVITHCCCIFYRKEHPLMKATY